MDFKRSYPKTATFLKENVTISRKNQQHSPWHWLTLILFGLLTVATLTQQLLLLVVFILIVALVKGPGLILWGALYTFLVGLFPPFGILLSILFFLLNLGTLVKNWRLSFTAVFFYGYPTAMMLFRYFGHWENHWFIAGSLTIGLLLLHFLLSKLYQKYGVSRMVFWYLFSLPFVLLTALLPTRLKGKFNRHFK